MTRFILLADNLGDIKLEQPKDGGEFKLEKVHLWVDSEHYVPLRLLMEGTVEVDGKKTPISIEKLDLDYKQAGPLYESHQRVHKLSGLMAGDERERPQGDGEGQEGDGAGQEGFGEDAQRAARHGDEDDGRQDGRI